jgi:hypothetical protein
MWVAASGQWFLSLKKVHDGFQLVEALSLSLGAPRTRSKAVVVRRFQCH